MTSIKFADGVHARLCEMNDLEIGGVARVLAAESPAAFATYIPGLHVTRLTPAAIERDLHGHGCAWFERCADIGGRIRRELFDAQSNESDLRHQKSDLETSLASTMTAWRKDIVTRDGLAASLRTQLDAAQRAEVDAHAQLDDACAERDALRTRAELAEATLAQVRAAVVGPPQDKEDTRPKVGDEVPWSEIEVGALYKVNASDAYPFRVVSPHTTALCSGDDDYMLESFLDSRYKGGTLIDALADFHEGQTHATLIARDLGTDPEAWRTAMREHLAKVGR